MGYYPNTAPDLAINDLSITELVFAGLENRPDEIVLTDGVTGDSMTALDFMQRVKALAGGLTAKGFGKGHTVALMAPNSPEFCVVFHAVALAGGTITTINPAYTENEINHQLNDSGAEMLITVPAFLAVAQNGAAGTGTLEIAVIGSADGAPSIRDFYGSPIAHQVPVDLDTHSVALPYSSGTTGLPKGVKLSHRNLVVNVDQTAAGAGFRTGEVASAFLPFFHIYGMNVL
ncbi:MAG: acyl-CoA synthetase (AMP-forming)/AMP-acid ligase II, partial [Reinekea sp.]